MKRFELLILVLVASLVGSFACTKAISGPTATPVVLVVTATPVPTATLPPTPPTPTAKATAAVPTPAVSTPMELSSLTHEVTRGETLSGIARMYGVSLGDLVRVNNIADPSLIRVGQKLALPKGAIAPPPTSTPTNTPAVPPTPTATPTPAATATPAATPTPIPTPTPAFDFRLDAITTFPNCGLTSVKGYMRDANGNGLANHTVKVSAVSSTWSTVSGLSGADGYYDVTLANEAKAGRWQVWVIGVNDVQLSPVVEVETNTTDCLPTGAGKQVYQVDFKRRY